MLKHSAARRVGRYAFRLCLNGHSCGGCGNGQFDFEGAAIATLEADLVNPEVSEILSFRHHGVVAGINDVEKISTCAVSSNGLLGASAQIGERDFGVGHRSLLRIYHPAGESRIFLRQSASGTHYEGET